MEKIDNYKIRTKKFWRFYEFERLWVTLTGLNIVALFLMIRGCTLQLITDNTIIYKLFYSNPEADKTLYNLSISYFAAYIFYIIQIYIPAKQKTINALVGLRYQMANLVLWVLRFLVVFDCFVAVSEEDNHLKKIIFARRRTIFLKNTEDFVYKVDEKRFEEMLGRIEEAYNLILSNEAFVNADYSLKKLLIEVNIYEDIKAMYNSVLRAEQLDGTGAIEISYFKDADCSMKKRMYTIKRLFDLNVNTDIFVTNKKEDIQKVKDFEDEIRKILSEHITSKNKS